MNDHATRLEHDMGRPGPHSVTVHGIQVKPGSRVRLQPGPDHDITHPALAGRIGIVEGIDHDERGRGYVTVTLEDDPGRDLGLHRAPAHRFSFRVEEIVPLRPAKRVLIAGIGNMFLGDDGFGCEMTRRLGTLRLPHGVTVEDFGIRGMDLAYDMAAYDAVVVVGAVPQGGEPGTLYVIDAEVELHATSVETDGIDPMKVLGWARSLGPLPDRVMVVGCEPAHMSDSDSTEVVGELSAPVRAAIEPATQILESLIAELTQVAPIAESREERHPEALNHRSTG